MTHHELQDLLPLHVLGSLEPEATAEVERHLAETCDACTAEVREWQEVLGLIPFGLTPTGPSPAVKERLMARIRRDLKVVPLRPRRRPTVWMTIPLAMAAAVLLMVGWGQYQETVRITRIATEQEKRIQTVEGRLTQEQHKLSDREAEIQRLTARLAEERATEHETAQMIAQLEASVAEQRQRAEQRGQELEQQQQRLARLHSEKAKEQSQEHLRVVAALERELRGALTHERTVVAQKVQEIQQLQSTLEQQRVLVATHTHQVEQFRDALTRQRGVIEVLSAPGLQVGYLGWAKRGVDSRGHVLWNEAKKTWLFYAFGLPQPPTGKEYQVWFMTEKEGPVSAGLFQPDQTGAGLVVAKSLPQKFGKVTAAAVTVEPLGGLPKPSGAMYLRGAF